MIDILANEWRGQACFKKDNTLSNQVVKLVLKYTHPECIRYSYIERSNDEQKGCTSEIDSPVCSIMLSKYARYSEYHISLGDFSLVIPSGLQGSYDVVKKPIECLELNQV